MFLSVVPTEQDDAMVPDGEIVQVGGQGHTAALQACRAKIDEIKRTTRIPDEIAGNHLATLAYLFLVHPDNECWASTADGTTNRGVVFANATVDHVRSTTSSGSMKVVTPYPDADGRHVILRCRTGAENFMSCVADFHYESCKQILLRHILSVCLTTVPPEDHIRYAKIAKIESIGFERNQSFSPFRIEERIDATALAYLMSVKTQIERQRAFCSILIQIRNTLDFLQRFRFAHGDLKLDNIGVKVLPNGCVQAYFLDFGLSCFEWGEVSIGTKTSVFFSRRNDPPVFLLQNDLLFLMVSTITKVSGLFYLGCADARACMLEKMILFILSAVIQDGGNIDAPYMVYEPSEFASGRRAALLSNRNMDAIVCTLILHYKTQNCNTPSPSAEERLRTCESTLVRISEEIARLNSPIQFDRARAGAGGGSPSPPPMMTQQRPERI